jgi:anti-sigma factor RsiW
MKRDRLPTGCEKIRNLVPEYVRGTLSDAETQIVEDHLQECTRCSEDVTDLRWIHSTLRINTQDYIFAHVSPEEMVGYVDEKEVLSVNVVVEIEKHIAVCRRCAREIEILQGINKNIRGQEIRELIKQPSESLNNVVAWVRKFFTNLSLRKRQTRYAVALAVIAAVLIILPLFFPRHPSVNELLTPTEAERGLEAKKITLLEPQDQSVVTTPAPQFTWEGPPRVLIYQFSLYKEDGTMVWKGETKENGILLPEEHSLENNQSYVWGVEADIGPEVTISSDLFLFTTRFDSK